MEIPLSTELDGNAQLPYGLNKTQQKSMKDAEPRMFPDALSHRDLSGLLKAALKDIDIDVSASDPDPLADDLQAWSEQTQTLLQRISDHGEAVGHRRSPQQVMALGSFRTHMMLGLQALRAAQS